MHVLPIAERELREVARHPKTWWRRVLVLAGAIAVFLFALVVLSQFANSTWIGQRLFICLSIVALSAALLAGPFTTADCLSRERREGTLGLLFLTNLRSYDVVLGKLVACSLDMALGLSGLLPLAAVIFLMGGVSSDQLGAVALTLATSMVLSLAVGVCASALFATVRSALAATLGVLLGLSIGLPFLVEGAGIHHPVQDALYVLCPSFTLHLAIDLVPRSGPAWQFWANLAGQMMFSTALLAAACFCTGRAWREQPFSALVRRWQERLERLRQPGGKRRRAWRAAMLERNPVAWLEGRDHWQGRVLWSGVLIAAIALALQALRSHANWPSDDWLVTWGLCSQYLFCLWVGIQAPRRLSEDKDSGALELLLCTPTSPREIVRGNLMLLDRRFGRTMAMLLALDAFLVNTYKMAHGGWGSLRYNGWDNWLTLLLYAFIVFPVQGWSVARIGVYHGLVNSWRATFIVLAKVAVLPWVLFIAFVVSWITAARYWNLSGMNDSVAFGVWALMHLVPCLIFVLHAEWQLRRNFRRLAATTRPRPWWKRLRPEGT